MGLVTLIFDLLTLKLVCDSHQRWGTFLPNLGALCLWVLELFAMYATDGRTETDGQKRRLLSNSLRVGHDNRRIMRVSLLGSPVRSNPRASNELGE